MVSKDPRLTAIRDGSAINQAPIQLPVVEHKGHRADENAIRRAKPKLRRRHAMQKITSLIRRVAPQIPVIDPDLLERAAKTGGKKGSNITKRRWF